MIRCLLALLLFLPLGACLDETEQGFQGYVEGEYLRMAAPDGGWLESVAVAKGARVTAGTLLFTLEPARERAALREAEARRAQAESELADLLTGSRAEEIAAIEAQLAEAVAAAQFAQLTLERQLELLGARVVAQSQVDSARAAARQTAAQVAHVQALLAIARLPARPDRVEAARNATEAARSAQEQAAWQLGRRRVTSPADALVDDVVRQPGEWVPTNGVVVSLLPPAAIKAVFFVPEGRRTAFGVNMVVEIACTGCPAGLTARISRIAHEAEYTPPVIYSRETRAKLVFRYEALLTPGPDIPMPNVPMPGQPITVRARP